MEKDMGTWQVIHIPDKPPLPHNQQATVDVYASAVEPKLANTLVRHLNQVAPLEDLRHVKRVWKKYHEEGQTKLSVILCLAGDDETRSRNMPKEVQELVNKYHLSSFIAKVYKFAASSKAEWEEQCKLWPTSYHPPTYNIDGITGFNEDDTSAIFEYMKLAIGLARSADDLTVNAAVIVEPSLKEIITTACDQVSSRCISRNKSSIKSCSSNTVLYRAVECLPWPSNESSDNVKSSYAGVACLNPWQWDKQPLESSCTYWHPLQHAAMVAIEMSAARDRRLYPSSRPSEDKWCGVNCTIIHSEGSPSKRQKIKDDGGHNCGGSCSLSPRHYLCTGYDIYLVWEPCTLCAMALVHQRIRRIFYAFPNPVAGALGSVVRLQGEKSLNHHYAVFRVLLPEGVLEKN